MAHEIEWLTVSQLATRFGVSVATIWRWVRENKFPAPVRVSDRCTRWERSAVEKHEQKLRSCA